MKAVLLPGLLALTACGVDGPPERPVAVQPIMMPQVQSGPATYTDANGIARTTGKSTSASSADVGVIPADL